MKEIRPASKLLGMKSVRNRDEGTLVLSLDHYIEKVLQWFNIGASKPVTTPLSQHFKTSAKDSPMTEEKKEHMKWIPYTNVVGSLTYAMVSRFGIRCECG